MIKPPYHTCDISFPILLVKIMTRESIMTTKGMNTFVDKHAKGSFGITAEFPGDRIALKKV